MSIHTKNQHCVGCGKETPHHVNSDEISMCSVCRTRKSTKQTYVNLFNQFSQNINQAFPYSNKMLFHSPDANSVSFAVGKRSDVTGALPADEGTVANTHYGDFAEAKFSPGMFDCIISQHIVQHDSIVGDSLQKYFSLLHRSLSDGGKLIVETVTNPSLGGDSIYNINHICAQIQRCGFRVTHKVNRDDVVTIEASKLITQGVTNLLFMPGMGDIYWGLTKVQSFIEKHDIQNPRAFIWDIDKKQIHGQQRSEGYLGRQSWIEYGGTIQHNDHSKFRDFYAHKTNKKLLPIWHNDNVHGCDYMFNMNGLLEIGEGIETGYGLEDYESNWFPEMYIPPSEIAQELEYKVAFGDYMFGYFTGTGLYKQKIVDVVTPEETYAILKAVYEETGCRTVITGTTWDTAASKVLLDMDDDGILIDMLGKTTTSQLYALMKGAKATFGWPAGNTIMSTYWKTPTVMMWSRELWHEDFAKNCIVPESHGVWYSYYYSEDFDENVKKTIIDELVGYCQ